MGQEAAHVRPPPTSSFPPPPSKSSSLANRDISRQLSNLSNKISRSSSITTAKGSKTPLSASSYVSPMGQEFALYTPPIVHIMVPKARHNGWNVPLLKRTRVNLLK
jgi:hypothetical protein